VIVVVGNVAAAVTENDADEPFDTDVSAGWAETVMTG
jgi:hypothetical protein